MNTFYDLFYDPTLAPEYLYNSKKKIPLIRMKTLIKKETNIPFESFNPPLTPHGCNFNLVDILKSNFKNIDINTTNEKHLNICNREGAYDPYSVMDRDINRIFMSKIHTNYGIEFEVLYQYNELCCFMRDKSISIYKPAPEEYDVFSLNISFPNRMCNIKNFGWSTMLLNDRFFGKENRNLLEGRLPDIDIIMSYIAGYILLSKIMPDTLTSKILEYVLLL